MKKILVIGASGHAKVIIDIIKKQAKYEIFGLIDSYKTKGTKINEHEILGTEEDLSNIIDANNIYGGIIAIGDNWTRRKLYKKITSLSINFEFITVIHPNVIIGENTIINSGTVIMAGSIINSDATIGKQCIINTKSSVGHDVVMKDFCSIAPGVTIGGDVLINKCSVISLGASIIECVEIGKHTVIGAGSLVNRNIRDYKIAFGVPAKEIKNRKKDDKYLGMLKTVKISSTYKLELYTISNATDIKKYNAFLEEFKDFSTFYSLQYCNYRDDNQLSYFILRKKHEAKVLMPICINKLNISKLENIQFYDAISPYGYSGPLLNNTNEEDIKTFWEKVDKWYKRNNVVTEFIRFNLDNNHTHYSGYLIPSLINVKGKIRSFETIWNNFKQKVRNNYRKSEKNNLTAKTYSGVISSEIINSFYSIYIKTMQRNAAAKNYFFPQDYFINLIEHNQNKILIAIVYKENTPISAELIIIDGDTLYSYLGGTLSEYFVSRPNDFLKIEVMKWAIENEKKHYILGGGRKDFDGLYQYKKSFFPKDDDVIFYTGRKIINKKIYNNLIKEIKVDYTNVNDFVSNSNTYFPIYKQINKEKETNCLSIITSKKEWQDVLDQVENYDFYHTYDYHNLSKEKDERAILIKYIEGDTLIGLPLIIRKINKSDYFDATSVYGYSGPLQKNVNDSFNNSNLNKALNQYFKEENIISVFSRLNPFIENQSTILEGMGETVKLGNVVNIDLTLPIDDQRTIFSKTTKRYLNKGRKSLKVICSSEKKDIKEFIKLYYENMDRVNAKSNYYFSEEYFDKFISSKDFKTDVLFAIELETNTIVSAAMMVKINNIIQYHISGTKNDFLSFSPIRLLIDEMRIKGTQENYTFFNLGGGLGNEGDELFKFKSSFSKDFKSFKVWKYITNQDVYSKLSNDNMELDGTVDFFPLYRYQE